MILFKFSESTKVSLYSNNKNKHADVFYNIRIYKGIIE